MRKAVIFAILCGSAAAFLAPSCTHSRFVRTTIQPHSVKSNVKSKTFYLELASQVNALDEFFQPSTKPGILSRLIRIGNHIPAFISISYFGLVSMASMIPGSMTVQPTLTSVLTKNVGPTTNKLFAEYFPTLVTPASFVFLIWPIISLVQIVTLTYSALQPVSRDAIVSQDNLTALSAANLAATWWLVVASQTLPGKLRIASCLILPLVPILSGYPLRTVGTHTNAPTFSARTAVFQLFSSFTTIASFLALTVELQHGGRLLPKLPAELAAGIFLSLYLGAVSMKNKSTIKKVVHVGAIFGIAVKRIQEAATCGILLGARRLFLSCSFWGTLFVVYKTLTAFKEDNQ